MTTTDRLTSADFTDAQRAEWSAAMDEVASLTEQAKEAQSNAGSWIVWSLDKNEERAAFAVEQARKAAQDYRDLWAQRMAANDRADALSYAALIQQNLADLREKREQRA